MRYKYILVFLLLFSGVFASQQIEKITRTEWVGCDQNNPSEFGCAGTITAVTKDRDTGIAYGTCRVEKEILESKLGCPPGYFYRSSGNSPFGVTGISLRGKLTQAEVISKVRSYCPYNLVHSVNIHHICVDKGFLGLWCNEWVTAVNLRCHNVICVKSETTSTETCTMTKQTRVEYYTVQTGGCVRPGTWCDVGNQNVMYCDSRGAVQVLHRCDASDFVCQTVSSNKAICVNPEERQEAKECTPDGSKRCNPLNMKEVQVCNNGEWAHHKTCLMSCNSTGVNNSVTECVDFNVEEGGCTNFDTACIEVRNNAYLFVCTNEDWRLISDCPTPRCNINATDCWDGCKLFTTLCYPENNSCRYCNEQGEWIPTSECLGNVNPVTFQCELPEKCETGAKTCQNEWVVECVNEEWRAIEKCSFGCRNAECVDRGVDVFKSVSILADALVLLIPPLSSFLMIIMLAGIPAYIIIRIIRRSKLWVEGEA